MAIDLIKDLEARGLIDQSSAPLEKILGKKRTIYIGTDPTADSLHAGHLLWLLLLKRLGMAGHSIIVLVGGGTGMIGDPREAGERSLLDSATLRKNTKALQMQIRQILGTTNFRMVDNAKWLHKVKLVDFLRDTGKYFTVNDLIKRDLIKRRLTTPNESISYTEFTYALLQGFDFRVLNEKYGCDVQLGGSDQWTNVLSGVDLIHKKDSREVFALSFPLVTDSNGKKFGKSEGNAVWLDAKKTSPYAFYQFWFNQPDEKVEQYLKFYTYMQVIEIEALCELHRRHPNKRAAQRMLAKCVTEIVHGKEAANNAEVVSEVLFDGKPFTELSPIERVTLIAEAPVFHITQDNLASNYLVSDALLASGLVTSKSEAKRLIEGNGVSINDIRVQEGDARLSEQDFENGLALLSRGKQLMVLVLD